MRRSDTGMCPPAWRALDATWRNIESPRKEQCEREAGESQSDRESQAQDGQFPRRKDSGRKLDDDPAGDDVRSGDTVHLSPPQLFEEPAHDTSLWLYER